MARIRKINVSQVEGNNNAVLPEGTIVAYEVNSEYVLRVHDGVTAGGVPFPNAPSIIHDNDINITVDSEDSSSYTWNFGQTGNLTFPDGSVQTTAYTGQTGSSGVTRYVAVNNNGTVYGSTDGENWTPYTSTMNSIGRVAVGPTNIVYTASRSVGNGQSLWYASAYNSAPTEVAPAENVEEDYSEVKYFSSIGKYVAVGHVVEGNSFPILLHSSDGVTWTRSYVSEEFIGQVSLTGSARFVDIAENDLGFFIISDSGTWGGFFLENITDALDATTNVEQAESDWEEVVWVETAAEGLRGWHVFDDDEDWRFNANEDPRVGSFDFFAVDDLDPEFEAAVGYTPDPSEIVVGEYDGVSTIVIGTGDGQIMYWPAEPANPTVVIPKPYTSSISDIIRGTTTEIEWSGTRNRQSDGEKIVITGVTTQQGEPGTTNQSYNGTYYIKDNEGDFELYTDQALTIPWDTTTYWPVNQNTGTLTWSHGQYIDALHYSNGVFYMGNDDEEFFISTDGGATWTETDSLTVDQGEEGGFINDIDSYGTTTTNKLINGTQEFTLNANGSVTFPDGSIQTTAYTGTTGDANVWVQTFETDTPATDVPAITVSVEYDDLGNIITLFFHQTDTDGSYYSVGKYTTAGVKLWTARFKDDFFTDGWGLAVDNISGYIYIAGKTTPENGGYDVSTLTKIDTTDGSVLWSKAYDFGYDSTSAVVDVTADGSPVMVGYASNGDDNYVTTTKVSGLDGSVTWSRSLNGQGNEKAYGMAVGPNSEVVAVGWMDQLDERATYSVTPQTGSTTEVLVINRSDLGAATFTNSWEVAGTGITGYTGVTFINSYSGLTGTVRQGSGASFNIQDNGDGTYSLLSISNGGTNYLDGHKIKIMSANIGGALPINDAIITVTGIDPGGIIVSGTIEGTAVGVTPAGYPGVTGTNYQTGSGLTFNLELDAASTYTEHPYNITAAGTNYVTGDVVVIPGTLLGGTTPTNDLTATVSVTNGGVTTFNTFSGTQQTTTYRIIVGESSVDFGGTGTWTLSNVSTITDDHMLVVKYNSSGAIQWQKAILFDEGFDSFGVDADIDSEGNVYVCGMYDNDSMGIIGQSMSILKLNSSGVKQWSRRVDGNCDGWTSSIVVGPDDHLYLSATTIAGDNPGNLDIHLVLAKYEFNGIVAWQRLLDYTDGGSVGSIIFQESGGGSNLAVKQDYVAVGGSFGSDFFGPNVTYALVAQVSAAGDLFTVGSWDFKGASFSGTLSNDASNIDVVNAAKTDTDNAANIDTIAVTLVTEATDFLIGTLYSVVTGADDRLVNGSNELVLETNGTVTLPQGGTITEAYVTSNPTIQLTPASPDVASQKLVIKGGGSYNYTDNGININYYVNTALVGDTLIFNVSAELYANQTLYWWIYPADAGISDPGTGTIALDETGYAEITFVLDSDDYEFTVRVSPENNNYDPANVGVESGLINADAPTYPSEHHLHLTTGDLTETSIFLGTDDHNVRTTTDGKIQITTPDTVNNIWEFGPDGELTLPTGGHIGPSGGKGAGTTYGGANDHLVSLTSYYNSGLYSSCVTAYADGTLNITAYNDGGPNPAKIWTFDNTGTLTLPDNSGIKSSTNIDITIDTPDSSTFNWRFGADGGLTFPDNTVQTTAYTGSTLTTVAKTVGTTPLSLGDLTFTTPLVDGNYGPFTLSNIEFTVQVLTGAPIYTITDVLNNATFTRLQVIGTLDSGDLGGEAGESITIDVSELVPTAIDLTKSVNKLTDGLYTLADGVEGQIMYLVRSPETISANVEVNVDNGDGANPLYPFRTNLGFTTVDNTGICTLIFTDGSWKQTGGNWD